MSIDEIMPKKTIKRVLLYSVSIGMLASLAIGYTPNYINAGEENTIMEYKTSSCGDSMKIKIPPWKEKETQPPAWQGDYERLKKQEEEQRMKDIIKEELKNK